MSTRPQAQRSPGSGAVPGCRRLTRTGLALMVAIQSSLVAAVECFLPIAAEEDAQLIDDIEELSGGQVLLRASRGGMRLVPGEWLATADSDSATGWIYDVEEVGRGRSVIGAEHGLFVSDQGSAPERIAPRDLTGAAIDVELVRSGVVVVGAARGLFRFVWGGEIVPISRGLTTARIRDVEALRGGRALAAGEDGVFAIARDGQVRRVGSETGRGRDIETQANGRVLVSAESGLFEYTRVGKLVRIETGLGVAPVHEIQLLQDGRVLLGTDSGVFQLIGESAHRVPNASPLSQVDEVEELSDGRVVVGSAEGAFRGVRESIESAEVWFLGFDVEASASGAHRVRFELRHPCAGSDGLDVRVSVRGDEGHVSEVRALPAERDASGGAAVYSAEIPSRDGALRLQATAFSAMAQRRIDIGPELSGQLARSRKTDD